MAISIAITTFNRANELRLTLASLAAMDGLHEVEHEVLVIGNNCTDETAKVARELAPKFAGRLRYIEEMQQGLSRARNRAVVEARYEVIAFLDDDVDVDPHWLIAMSNAHGDARYAVVGGRASLLYPIPQPRWLGERDEGLLTKVELGLERRLAKPDELFGLNFSIRREWFNRVGSFRVDLGRIGKCLLGGEETELLERIERAGGAMLYEPEAFVRHRVPTERLRRRWFWSRTYWGVRGEVIKLPAEEITSYTVIRAWWRLMREVARAGRSLVASGLRSAETFHRNKRVVGRWAFAIGISRRWISAFGNSLQPDRVVCSRPSATT